MSDQLKFYLDDIEVENPDGWRDIVTTIKRDKLFNSLLVNQDIEVEFTGNGYQYLYEKLQDSFCNVVELKIFDNCGGSSNRQIIRGNIFVSLCRFDEKNCKARTPIEDRSYYSQINNNKSIKTSPFTDKSKNLVDITTATTYNLDIYNVTSNALVRSNAQAVTVYEAFRFLVDFMTDGEVGFESDTFNIGGEWEWLCITTGYQLRTASAAKFPQFSFVELWDAVQSRIPIGFKIVSPYDNPIIKIEALSEFYGSSIAYDFTDVNAITTSVDQQKLYAKIKFKTGAVNDSLTLPFPEDIDFFGFKEEEFFIVGSCNLDTALELNCNWIVSSNVIQSVVDGDQSYDTSLFLIQSILTDASNGRTSNTDFLQVSAYYYNELLTNYQTAVRYIGFVPNSLASYFLINGSGTFHSYLPSDITHTATVAPDNDDYNPLALSAEVFDVSGDYDTVTYRFTAPATGVYRFISSVQLNTSGGVGTGSAYFQAYLRQFDNTGTIKPVGDVIVTTSGTSVYGYRMFTANTFLGGVPYRYIVGGDDYTFEGNKLIVMIEGDYVEFRFSKVGTTGDVDYTIQSGEVFTYLKCLENSIGSGIFQTGDPSTYPALLHEFEYQIARDDFENIIENNTSLVTFAMNGKAKRAAWIENITYNEVKGVATVKLITDKTTQNAH